MKRSRGRLVDLNSPADLELRIAAGASAISGWHFLSLDLAPYGGWLRRVEVGGALFLGCRFGPGDEESVRARGAMVFPQLPGTPVDSYRTGLYTADELYGHGAYADSLDARAYGWAHRPPAREATLARALHDHSIDAALGAWAGERRLVGIMGAHAVTRGEAGYAAAARLGHLLGTSLTVATGGGPGAMEAANLGARLAGASAGTLTDALGQLASVPHYHPSVDAWAASASEVLQGLEPDLGATTDALSTEALGTEALATEVLGTETLGIPTWHYGHEPPNLFASAIAKMFTNALRESVLLQLCDAGVVVLPGAAGTVQEIFTDACENYYADPGTVAPLVLVGRRHWTEELPAWGLLTSLAQGRPMAEHIHLVDSPEEAAEILLRPA